LLVLIFGQLSNREGLRDLIITISPFQFAFHHLGFGKSVSRSNLSKANEVRDVRIFQEFADRMVSIARGKVDGIKDFFLSNKVYAFDSSTISLCLSIYWWAKMHHGKGGVKLHTLYDVKTDIPAFVVITDAALHDSQVMGLIPYEKDSFYVFDRAYMDTKMLYLIHKQGAFFVVREKHKMVFDVVEDKNYNNPATGVMADQIIRFKGNKTKKNYPEVLRRVIFYDREGNRTFVFCTNNYDITAEEVALLYKFRWRVELFLKEMKDGLRADRMSCSSFSANQFRLFLHAAAYVLLLEAKQRLFAKSETLATATVITLRKHIILQTARITELKTKIKIEFQRDNPMREEILQALMAV